MPSARPQAKARSTRIGKTITLLLHYPGAAKLAGEVQGLDEVDQPGAPLLRQLLEVTTENPHLNLASLLERYRGDPDEKHVRRLAGQPPPPVEDDSAAAVLLRDSLERIVEEHAAIEQRRRATEPLRRARRGPQDGRQPP